MLMSAQSRSLLGEPGHYFPLRFPRSRCRRWHPDILAAAPKKILGHRALDDIRESIAELKFYREKLFVA